MTVLAVPGRQAGSSRTRRLMAPVATAALLSAATVALAVRDPHEKGSWGLCPSATLGFDCPGCGGLRAVNDLTHGRLVDAASSNLLLVVAIPVAVLLLARWGHDAWRGTDRAMSPVTVPLLVLAGAALLTFTVLRNLPAFGWLAA